MQLKPYQQQALSALTDFLSLAQDGDPAAAFDTVLDAPTTDGLPTLRRRLGRYARPYRPPTGLGDVPYVCLRLPTGGGKTLLAAHAVRAARDGGIGGAGNGDWPLVLWLVPSDIIRTQTADALSDPRHPYRAALDAAFEGRVRVFDIADFAQVRPHDLAQNACIVVATIQTLRVTDTNRRKVYGHHEDLEPHFSRLDAQTLAQFPGLERLDAPSPPGEGQTGDSRSGWGTVPLLLPMATNRRSPTLSMLRIACPSPQGGGRIQSVASSSPSPTCCICTAR